MNRDLPIKRKLEIYFYVFFILVGVYLTLKSFELNLITEILDKQKLSYLDLSLIVGLLMIGNGIAFLIFILKRKS